MKKLICLLAGVLMIAACDKKDDPIEKARISIKDKDLQNNFVSNCDAAPGTAIGTALSTGFQGKTAGYKTSYKFAGNKLDKKIEAYSTNDCSGDPNYEYVETGTFDVNKDEKTKSNDGGYPLNVTYEDVTLKVISEEGLKVANAAKLCGVTSWAKDKVEKVKAQSSNANCYGLPYGQDGKRQVFTRYRVDNKILTLGSEKANAERDRPTTLEATKYMQK